VRSRAGFLRQFLHFGGDDGKAAPGIARACRLYRGVERQQIGLPRDAADHIGDMGDGLERFAKAVQPLMNTADLIDQIDKDMVGGGELSPGIVDDGTGRHRLGTGVLPGIGHAFAIVRQLRRCAADRLDRARLLRNAVGQFADVGL